MSKKSPSQDYLKDKEGNITFTKEYHLKRGYCCMSGCLNCPFGYTESSSEDIPKELLLRNDKNINDTLRADELCEIYAEFNKENDN